MSPAPPPPLLEALGGTVADYASTSLPRRSSSVKDVNPSIFFIVLILAITVFASVSVCLLLRYLNRRCLLHLSTVISSSSSSSSAAAAASGRISHAEPAPVEASSPIDSLQLFSFSSVTRRPSAAAADCAVCLSKFEPYDQLRLLPLCCHAFHAHCIDTWLQSNQTCPLCRSSIFVSESDILKASIDSSAAAGRSGDSFRLEIGSISRGNAVTDSGDGRRSYSLGSFDYIVEDESEVSFNHSQSRSNSVKEDVAAPAPLVPSEENLAAEVASGRNRLKDYVDRLSNSLSSRALSFRSSGRLFTGSSRRSEVTNVGDWDVEAQCAGEEISELFRWFSGV